METIKQKLPSSRDPEPEELKVQDWIFDIPNQGRFIIWQKMQGWYEGYVFTPYGIMTFYTQKNRPVTKMWIINSDGITMLREINRHYPDKWDMADMCLANAPSMYKGTGEVLDYA